MDYKVIIERSLERSIEVKRKILENEDIKKKILDAAKMMISTIKKGFKIIACGNGGSAADAQHIIAELQGKFYKNRKPLPAISLTVNTSVLTAVGNDFGFNEVFSRQVKGVGKEGDVLLAISTSGNSANVINAAIAAREIGMKVICLTGKSGGKLKEHCDILINVPDDDTPRIQEAHITIGHIICQIVEEEIFK